VDWLDLEQGDRDLAELGRSLFEARVPEGMRRPASFTGYAFLGTVRLDGSPRINPVCPVITGGVLYVATRRSSPKIADLRRDGRYVLHALPGDADEEFSVRGRATEANDPESRVAFAEAAAGWMTLHDDEVVFRYHIARGFAATWENVSRPDTRPVHRWWPALRR
jgi:hypothetical protein